MGFSKGCWLLSLLILSTSCATTPTSAQSQGASATPRPNEPPSTETPNTYASPVTPNMIIDIGLREKARPLFEAVIKNDDKKAKLAYGRAVRALPELVQLALDLRFKNYEHALTILPKTPLSEDQKDFWGKIIAQKPKKLSQALCQELIARVNFPAPGSKAPEEEVVWLKYFDDVAREVINPEASNKEPSELNKELLKITCTEKDCGPIPDGIRDELLTDKFFDQIHNMRRRDTLFYANNFRSPLKLGQYRPWVADMGLLKFYKALKGTLYTKQMHFLRRFKGIARDMRADTILSRSIADIIMGDDQDLVMAKRLGTFLTSNSLISAITRIENEIPSCQIK